jgi:tetratricopeptide (TPR) repeat protein
VEVPMKNRIESLPLVLALLFSAGLMTWIVWSQRPATPETVASTPETVAAMPSQVQTPAVPDRQPVDEARAAELRVAAESEPEDAQVRVDLANLYFDSHQFDDAIPWFEAALSVDPTLVDVSTDLGVAYYYINETDRSLAQFARSLEVDPTHAQTILNLGIVRAFGKQDLEGAFEAWEEVQRVAPGSPEALAAADATRRLTVAHP